MAKKVFIFASCFVLVLLVVVGMTSLFAVGDPAEPAVSQKPQKSLLEFHPPSLSDGNSGTLPMEQLHTPKPIRNEVVKPVLEKIPLRGGGSSVMAWIFPGEPGCAAAQEIQDGRVIDVLKPEYFTVSPSGELLLKTEKMYGCNGYSVANVALLKAHSAEQYVTISSSAENMRALLSDATHRDTAIKTILVFLNESGFTGVEIDFEDYGVWSDGDYSAYKAFVSELGLAVHAAGKKLMIDAPPISNDIEQGYYNFRYADFNTLPIDYLVIMAYDYAFDYGVGEPLAPFDWTTNVITRAQREFTDRNKLVIGIPSYSYRGVKGDYSYIRETFEQSKQHPGFTRAIRDAASGEMRWSLDGAEYVFQDTETLNVKRAHIESLGVGHISVWHLGGNAWFSE